MNDLGYDAEVQELAEYFLANPPWRAATTEAHDRRVHALALAIQETIDRWLEAHPLTEDGKQRRGPRWRSVQERED